MATEERAADDGVANVSAAETQGASLLMLGATRHGALKRPSKISLSSCSFPEELEKHSPVGYTPANLRNTSLLTAQDKPSGALWGELDTMTRVVLQIPWKRNIPSLRGGPYKALWASLPMATPPTFIDGHDLAGRTKASANYVALRRPKSKDGKELLQVATIFVNPLNQRSSAKL